MSNGQNSEVSQKAMLEKMVEDGLIPSVREAGSLEWTIVEHLLLAHRGLSPEQQVLYNAGNLMRMIASCVAGASGFKE